MTTNELYHSEIYLGKDYRDGIKHYRYIKREMKNGRYRYYYTNDVENQRKILNKNMKMEKDMIKKNKSYMDTSGKVYGRNHYIKALESDKKDLKKLNKKISKQSKIAKTASKAAVKVANTVSDTKYEAKKKVNEVLKNLKKKK